MSERKRKQIKRALADRGLSNKQLAERAGISESMASRVINGSRTPRLPLALKIARVLRVPISALAQNPHARA